MEQTSDNVAPAAVAAQTAATASKRRRPRVKKTVATTNGSQTQQAKRAPMLSLRNLPEEITPEEVEKTLQTFGPIALFQYLKTSKTRKAAAIVFFVKHKSCEDAIAALNEKPFPGHPDQPPVQAQYANQASFVEETVLTALEGMRDVASRFNFGGLPILRSLPAQDFIRRKIYIAKSKPPTFENLCASLLIKNGLSTENELIGMKMVNSNRDITNLLKGETIKAANANAKLASNKAASANGNGKPKQAPLSQFGWDSFSSQLTNLERDRWNLLQKANSKLEHRKQFRLEDMLVTPQPLLRQWMQIDCGLSVAEGSTCVAILVKYYGYSHTME